MSDVDTTSKLIGKLQDDFFADPVQNEADIDVVAKQLRTLLQQHEEYEEVFGNLLESDGFDNYDELDELPINMLDQVYHLTENLDAFQKEKLWSMVS